MIIALEIDDIVSTPLSNSYALNEVHECKIIPGAKEALEKLKKLNHTILIYSKRDVSLIMDTEVWLQKNKIPYDQILLGKPRYDILLDDKAFKFTNWNEFLEKYKHTLQSI